MSMKSLSSPRRLYLRAGKPVVLYGGFLFSMNKGTSKVDADKNVRIEALPRSHGKARIQITQGSVTETWSETSLGA
jgi:hypothetical protein